MFIGMPFVVRTLQPVLEDLDAEIEEAAASLGATRWQTFRRVILPTIVPALLTGFALAFARAVGEYGSVVFISGNMPMKTEIAPLLIMTKLEQFDYAGATAIAVVMLVASFAPAAGDQPAAVVEPAARPPRTMTMAGTVRLRLPAASAAPIRATALTEPRSVRWLLIAAALGFLALFLLLPLVGRLRRGLAQGRGGLCRGADRAGRAGGDPADAAHGADRRAAQRRLRRSPRPGRSPSSSSSARAC